MQVVKKRSSIFATDGVYRKFKVLCAAQGKSQCEMFHAMVELAWSAESFPEALAHSDHYPTPERANAHD